MARVPGVSRAGYHAWAGRPPSAHAEADAALLERIRAVHAASRETHGAPRVHAQLRAGGERHGRKRIARLTRGAGTTGASRGNGGPVTTRRDRGARPAPDLAGRDFSAPGPDRLWVTDITSIPTAAGFLHLAVVLDAWSRRVVGWSMANHLRTEPVLAALEMSPGRRRSCGTIPHSDQGSQFTSLAFGDRRREAGVRPSMGSVGDACDDAMCESFFASLECELLARRRFASQAEARMAVFSFIEGFYNPVRLHSALGHIRAELASTEGHPPFVHPPPQPHPAFQVLDGHTGVAFPVHEGLQHGEGLGEAVAGGGPVPPGQAFEPGELRQGDSPDPAVLPDLVQPPPQPEGLFFVVGGHARAPRAPRKPPSGESSARSRPRGHPRTSRAAPPRPR